MRNAFAAIITELAAADPRVVLLSGDIGNRLFDNFKAKFPDRFYNCGVAEANMTGMAAGMAMNGLRPFTYTITPFGTTRVLEQIRVDVCYHNVPVTIVGTGSGLSYASLGPTHHSCEDVALLRCLPNMTVICPADSAEVRSVCAAVLKHDGPAYIRLGKKGEPAVHSAPPALTIGKGLTIRDGSDICILGMGNLVCVGVDAAKLLSNSGLSARVVSMHTVKPLDEALLGEVFEKFTIVAVVEEHGPIGGLGSAVAEWLAARPPQRARLIRFNTGDEFIHEAGDQEYARKRFGLTAENIAGKIKIAHSRMSNT
jgi:transketolase